VRRGGWAYGQEGNHLNGLASMFAIDLGKEDAHKEREAEKNQMASHHCCVSSKCVGMACGGALGARGSLRVGGSRKK